MRVFVTALDEGSLAAAGRKLGHSAAAVTRAIGFLETHVGAQLLHRSTREVSLTDVGSAYLEPCTAAVRQAQEAARIAAHRRVRISTRSASRSEVKRESIIGS